LWRKLLIRYAHKYLLPRLAAEHFLEKVLDNVPAGTAARTMRRHGATKNNYLL
jgi:hypothetical protein